MKERDTCACAVHVLSGMLWLTAARGSAWQHVAARMFREVLLSSIASNIPFFGVVSVVVWFGATPNLL